MSQDKSLSGGKRFWALARMLLVMVGSCAFGLWMSGALDHSDPAPADAMAPTGMIIIAAILAFLFLAAGGVVYGVVLLTNCFTLNMSKPFMPTIGRKMWLANLAANFLFSFALANVAAMFLTVPAAMVLQGPAVYIVSSIIPFALLQFFFVWFQLISPVVPRLVRARLTARGITREQVASARIIGTSDPELKKTPRFSMTEQDLGALWITAEHLLFMGDQCDWTIRHEQLIAVEREAFAKSAYAYFGAVHVILRFRVDGRPEQRIRLHDEQAWTATGAAKGLEAIAGRLEAWLANPTAGWPEARGLAVATLSAAPPQAG